MNGGLLMLAGHAIYEGGRWHGGHQNEDGLYETHVRDAFRIFATEGYHALALSGGRSRPHLANPVSNSEAQGMLEYAREAGLGGVVLLEQFGRDSFENVLFSMLCFHKKFGEWPSRVGAVSWKFKALRFYLIACGLRLAEGRFRFFGSGDPAGQAAIEAFAAASVQYDAMIVRGGENISPGEIEARAGELLALARGAPARRGPRGTIQDRAAPVPPGRRPHLHSGRRAGPAPGPAR